MKVIQRYYIIARLAQLDAGMAADEAAAAGN